MQRMYIAETIKGTKTEIYIDMNRWTLWRHSGNEPLQSFWTAGLWRALASAEIRLLAFVLFCHRLLQNYSLLLSPPSMAAIIY